MKGAVISHISAAWCCGGSAAEYIRSGICLAKKDSYKTKGRLVALEKTVCELFAGAGGFRCGLNNIRSVEDAKKPEKWETVWFSQWEPADRKIQWAHGCYVNRFGTRLDLNGADTTNKDISTVDKKAVPEHALLVGGFPCQDYSVASGLAASKGLEGKKGSLWWDIRDMLEEKETPFVLLENVDRLIKSRATEGQGFRHHPGLLQGSGLCRRMACH